MLLCLESLGESMRFWLALTMGFTGQAWRQKSGCSLWRNELEHWLVQSNGSSQLSQLYRAGSLSIDHVLTEGIDRNQDSQRDNKR